MGSSPTEGTKYLTDKAMNKMTFREAMEKDTPFYEVAKSGSISSYKPSIQRGGLMRLPLDATTWHLNDNGTINIGWGYAVFANAEDAAEVAKRIVTTKFENSIKKIKKVTGF